jgi:aryl-alcohol dehydrogenase-like predicted oxidoreductase
MAVAKRELGRTGLQVTALGYGAMELHGAPRARDITEAQSETILNKVLDAGINYVDTSIDYGLSEERIGRYISHRRAEYYLASKCGCLVGAPPAPRGQRGQHVFTRENVVAGVEQSLVRMKTDYLDVVQFHSSPSRQTLEEHGSLEALLELREAGKVRFIGMSGTLPHLIDHIAMDVFDVFQIPYSAVEREHEAAIATAAQKGAGIVIRGGAAKGAPAEGKQAGLRWERWRRTHLDDLLDGMTPMEFILRFTFTNPDLDTTIVGTINPAHLQTNLDILDQGPLLRSRVMAPTSPTRCDLAAGPEVRTLKTNRNGFGTAVNSLLGLIGLLISAHPAVGQPTSDWITALSREPIHVRAWPGEKKVAVCFVLYVEVWGFGHGPNFRPDTAARDPDVVEESFRQ